MSKLARVAALVAAGTLTTSGLVAGLTSPAAAAVGQDPRPVAVGASWLEGQLTNGLIHNTQYDFDDYGLSIDAGLALEEVGHHATVAGIANALAPKVEDSYAQGDEYASTPPYAFVQRGYYAGATAKSLVFAQAVGADPTTWAGFDLVQALQDRVVPSGPSTGRISDDSSYGDYANVIGQAFAANGLSAAASSEAGHVVSFLLQQQCSDGYFRLNFTESPTAPDQSCDGGVAAGNSTPDTDATAMAVLQLEAITSPAPEVTAAIAKAKTWLLAAQRADGSFGGGASTEGANTNSTGLAGRALGELGEQAAAVRAAIWVRAHQADNPAACPDALSGQAGAIGYDDAGVATGRVHGITTATQDQWRRSTAPTLPVLQWAPAATSPFTLTGPTGFVKAGTTATYRVTGAAPGTTVCVSGIGASRRETAGADGATSVAVTMPRGTAVRVATAASRTASDTASVQVLGRRTFKVLPSRWTVHRGARVHVVVRGLVRGERVVLRLRGVKVRVGTANGRGRFATDVRVGHRLGKARIVAAGQFAALRHGRAVVRVVR